MELDLNQLHPEFEKAATEFINHVNEEISPRYENLIVITTNETSSDPDLEKMAKGILGYKRQSSLSKYYEQQSADKAIVSVIVSADIEKDEELNKCVDEIKDAAKLQKAIVSDQYYDDGEDTRDIDSEFGLEQKHTIGFSVIFRAVEKDNI